MKTKILLITVLILSFFTQNSYSQEIDANRLRRLALHSDVILVGTYKKTTTNISDYAIEEYITFTKIDTMIANSSKFTLKNSKIKILQDITDYPVFWGFPCICNMGSDATHIEKRYSNVLFFRKNNKEHKLIGGVGELEWDIIVNRYLPAITEIKNIEKITDLNERYSKTIDWYIENNNYPDSYFIDFYKQKGIIKDNIVLTDSQLKKAEQNFTKGNRNLLPFFNNQFSKAVNAYLLQELKNIRRIITPTFSDYLKFKDIILSQYKLKNGSIEDLLLNQLTLNDEIKYYDKYIIMDYFIEMFERDKISGKEEE